MRTKIEGLGPRMRNARQARGLTQDDLARDVGVRCLAISEAERGEATPHASTVVAVANRLGVSTDWLLTGKGDGPSSTELDASPAESP